MIEEIAKNGRDCVIVGRNADTILAGEKPFSIFVCADMDTKVRRCMERAAKDEKLSQKVIEQNIRRIDKNRAQTREMVTRSKWGQGSTYHMVVNSSGWNMGELAPAVADFAVRWFEREKKAGHLICPAFLGLGNYSYFPYRKVPGPFLEFLRRFCGFKFFYDFFAWCF